jgi:hypothetical protein
MDIHYDIHNWNYEIIIKIVMEAVKNNGYLLKYSLLELRNNYKIVIESVKNKGNALGYTLL